MIITILLLMLAYIRIHFVAFVRDPLKTTTFLCPSHFQYHYNLLHKSTAANLCEIPDAEPLVLYHKRPFDKGEFVIYVFISRYWLQRFTKLYTVYNKLIRYSQN